MMNVLFYPDSQQAESVQGDVRHLTLLRGMSKESISSPL